MATAVEQRSSNRRRREAARDEVLRVALELAEERPFRDVTVDEIARGAGISRSAFYTHFSDKYELLLAAVQEVADELYRMSELWWSGGGPPADRIREAIEGVVSVYAEQARVLRVATEVSTYDDEVRAFWFRIMDRFVAATAEHIRSEQRAGLIPDLLEPQATAESLVWMVERCAYIYLARGERSPEEVVEGMAPVWTAALYPGVIPADELRASSAPGRTATRSRPSP